MLFPAVNDSSDDTCVAVTLFTTMIATMLSSSLESGPSNDQMCPILPNFYFYDFIVIGAGTAGSVIASRLSDNPSWQVFVLEAGPEEVPVMDIPSFAGLYNPAYLWNLTAKTPSGGGSQPITSAKILGGASTINYMMYIRGNRGNFDKWASMGNTGWDYESVLPYFKKSENNLSPNLASDTSYHGTGGPLSVSVPDLTGNTYSTAFLDAFQTIGLSSVDYNSGSQIGASVPQFTIKNGVRQSTNKAFLEPAKPRKNLLLKTKSRATKIVIDPLTKKALAVTYIDENGKSQIVYAAKEIIVSAGVYHSAQLLMLSGIGPRADLSALGIPVVSDLPVGKHLQDQVAIHDVFTFNVTPPPSSSPLVEKMSEWNLYSANHTGPLAIPSGIVTAFQSFGEDPSMADVHYAVYKTFTGTGSGCENTITYESTFYNQLVLIPTLVNPNSVGQITLKNSDPSTPPVIDPGILKNPEDRRVLVEALKALYNITDSDALKKNGIKFDGHNVSACVSFLSDPTMDSYWNCVIRQNSKIASHATSSCPMGPSDNKFAVIDSKLQVYGVRNLRVVGAAAMPTMISGNTMASSVMIAEKCSDLIKNFWT